MSIKFAKVRAVAGALIAPSIICMFVSSYVQESIHPITIFRSGGVPPPLWTSVWFGWSFFLTLSCSLLCLPRWQALSGCWRSFSFSGLLAAFNINGNRNTGTAGARRAPSSALGRDSKQKPLKSFQTFSGFDV
jgi:hypothetical protein